MFAFDVCVRLLQRQEIINLSCFRLLSSALNHVIHGHDTAVIQSGGEEYRAICLGKVSRFTSQLSGNQSGRS